MHPIPIRRLRHASRHVQPLAPCIHHQRQCLATNLHPHARAKPHRFEPSPAYRASRPAPASFRRRGDIGIPSRFKLDSSAKVSRPAQRPFADIHDSRDGRPRTTKDAGQAGLGYFVPRPVQPRPPRHSAPDPVVRPTLRSLGDIYDRGHIEHRPTKGSTLRQPGFGRFGAKVAHPHPRLRLHGRQSRPSSRPSSGNSPSDMRGSPAVKKLAKKAKKSQKKPQKRKIEEAPEEKEPKLQALTSSDLENTVSTPPPAHVAAFADMALEPEVVQAITTTLGYTQPTPIQAHIPTILDVLSPNGSKNTSDGVLCAAETGSGKTMAYLAPIFSLLKTHENQRAAATVSSSSSNISNSTAISETLTDLDSTITTVLNLDPSSAPPTTARLSKPRNPRAIILVPTRELVSQIRTLAAQCSHTCKLQTVALTSALSHARIEATLAKQPLDVIISTPGLLARLIASNQIYLTALQYLVIDEADTVLDPRQGFDAELATILNVINHRPGMPKNARIKPLFVTATLPRSVSTYLSSNYPALTRLVTPRLHKTRPRLTQKFVHVTTRQEGNARLAKFIKDAVKTNERILVFANTVEKCNALMNIANKEVVGQHHRIKKLHSGIPFIERSVILKNFREAKGFKCLVATDIASRGLDTTYVDQILLFDFPKTMQDYLHRVGRTARGPNGKGLVTSLVWPYDQNLAAYIRRQLKSKSVHK
ncbi:hypothetical protein SeMB42_g06996 [Synchytrium endobioticum]|uniref:RNA helicase n=1 Tax=Synchytrium endobioticum TaxID=286115 RepID=A0A507CG02_9FUNG|nr:hypothetical protein SeMB42_g06996 [Synchytrium endobioticum]TPX39546.1 hypothetical protein SeLEV6574_g07128 [Synchytrium endobioticum]